MMSSSHLAPPPPLPPSSLCSPDAHPLLCTRTPSRLLQRRRRWRSSNLSRSMTRRTKLERTRSALTVRARDGGAAPGEVETAVVERPRPSRFQVSRGQPMPLGATARDGGVNFSVYSSNAASATLCLISLADLNESRVPEEISLDPMINRTGDVWHVFLKADFADVLYGYKFDGKFSPEEGHRYDASRILLDPYAKAVISRGEYGILGPEGDCWSQMACRVPADGDEFDWEGDLPLKYHHKDLIIYEMHVRGFTRHDSSKTDFPGTYRGVVEKLDHFKELGVNCIELMPCHEFNELEYFSYNSVLDDYKMNFWGYSTINYFSPMVRYSSAGLSSCGQDAINEFKTLIKEAHKRGIEVLMDVVFNHTAEGNEDGPVLSFRGIDNSVYYMLAPKGEFYNYSGCGNTLNCNHPAVRQFILDCLRDVNSALINFVHHARHHDLILEHAKEKEDFKTHSDNGSSHEMESLGKMAGVFLHDGALFNHSSITNMRFLDNKSINFVHHARHHDLILEHAKEKEDFKTHSGYWVTEMHVDGFRFDLASILTRSSSLWDADNVFGKTIEGDLLTTGAPLSSPPLIDLISNDPILRGVKLIAEAWDTGGLYQVGTYPHWGIWSEWNGKYRDVVRQFIKGTDGFSGAFAESLCGSPNLYQEGGRRPWNSVNFVCAHDGFTLADLVSYNDKHNLANGEDNNDGESHNNSWNCGQEGELAGISVKRLRKRQMRNFFVCLMVSQGIPMIYMGDEYGHTKGGNNNSYCHDNYINYFQWDKKEESSSDFYRFCSLMTKFRHECESLGLSDFPTAERLQWHGHLPGSPDWSEASRFVACTMVDSVKREIYIAFNASHLPVTVVLPERPGYRWEPLVDTSKPAPFDFLSSDLPEREVAVKQYAQFLDSDLYPMLSYSSIILVLSPDSSA